MFLDNIIKSTNNKKLKIDKHLPMIVLPENKIKMFKDWWDNDIRFESIIPHSFNEGYLQLEDPLEDIEKTKESLFSREFVRLVAKAYNRSVYEIKDMFSDFVESYRIITIYFKFLSEDEMFLEIYDKNNNIITKVNFKVGKTEEPGNTINELLNFNISNSINDISESMDMTLNSVSKIFIAILIAVLWYLATTTTTTKYYNELNTPKVNSRHKNIVKVSDNKFIKTPIYDLSKIRYVKVDRLIASKKGWTYSHSFQVHGHYRHYKNGKVIFIKPFVKGKDKPFKNQTIYINPQDKKGICNNEN